MSSSVENDEKSVKEMILNMEANMMQQFAEVNRKLEEKMDKQFVEVNQRLADLTLKVDDNKIEMNQRFAAVEERFVKSEAILESTKEQTILVDKTLNERLTLVKDEVSANIERQIGEARAEFQEVITETNQRVATLSETVDKSLSDTKAFANFKALENEVKTDAANKGVATVTSRLEHFISKEFPMEVRTVMRPKQSISGCHRNNSQSY